MSHVTHMNESCHTGEWVMSHVWMSHVSNMNESCHKYEWIMSHIWMISVTVCAILQNACCERISRVPYEWVMSRIWSGMSMLQYVAAWCSVVQSGAVSCSVLQRGAVCRTKPTLSCQLSGCRSRGYQYVIDLLLMSYVGLSVINVVTNICMLLHMS